MSARRNPRRSAVVPNYCEVALSSDDESGGDQTPAQRLASARLRASDRRRYARRALHTPPPPSPVRRPRSPRTPTPPRLRRRLDAGSGGRAGRASRRSRARAPDDDAVRDDEGASGTSGAEVSDADDSDSEDDRAEARCRATGRPFGDADGPSLELKAARLAEINAALDPHLDVCLACDSILLGARKRASRRIRVDALAPTMLRRMRKWLSDTRVPVSPALRRCYTVPGEPKLHGMLLSKHSMKGQGPDRTVCFCAACHRSLQRNRPGPPRFAVANGYAVGGCLAGAANAALGTGIHVNWEDGSTSLLHLSHVTYTEWALVSRTFQAAPSREPLLPPTRLPLTVSHSRLSCTAALPPPPPPHPPVPTPQ